LEICNALISAIPGIGTLAGPLLKTALEYAPLFADGFNMIKEAKKVISKEATFNANKMLGFAQNMLQFATVLAPKTVKGSRESVEKYINNLGMGIAGTGIYKEIQK